jgi:hypothetical protein
MKHWRMSKPYFRQRTIRRAEIELKSIRRGLTRIKNPDPIKLHEIQTTIHRIEMYILSKPRLP